MQAVHGARHADRLRVLREVSVALAADDDRCALRAVICDSALFHLRVQRVARHDDDHRHVLVDERERAVLELAGEDALRVHIRDRLDLERALETCRVLEAAAEDEQTARVGEYRRRERLEGLVRLEHLLDLAGRRVKTVDEL